MAILFPSELSPLIKDDPVRKGEVDTYNALSALPDDYVVFYDRCVREGHAVDANEAPIDFLVLHEKLGMLAIEVKGGKIRINERGVIEHFYNKKWNAKDPLKQLKDAVHKLIRAAKNDGVNYFIPVSLCVVFPNTLRQDLKGKAADATLCADDLKVFPVQIPVLFKKSHRSQAWSHENFIDIQRRLRNMPHSDRSNWSDSKKVIKKKSSNTKRLMKDSTRARGG